MTHQKWCIVQQVFFNTVFFYICIALFMATSLFPWKKFTEFDWINSVMSLFQLPDRVFMETVPVLFIIAPIIIERIKNQSDNPLSKYFKQYGNLLSILIIVFSSVPVFNIFDVYNRKSPDKTPLTGGYNDTELTEYLPSYADSSITTATEQLHNFGSETLKYSKNGSLISITCKVYDKGAYVCVPLYYYPCYHAFDDMGQEYELSRTTEGKMQLLLPMECSEKQITIKPRI